MIYICPNCKKEYKSKSTISSHLNKRMRCAIDYCWCGKMVTNYDFKYGGYTLVMYKGEYIGRICCSKEHEQMVHDRKICSNCGKENVDKSFVLCKSCKSVERGIKQSNEEVALEVKKINKEAYWQKRKMAEYQGKLHNYKSKYRY